MSKPYDRLRADLSDVEALVECARRDAGEIFVCLYAVEYRSVESKQKQRQHLRETLASLFLHLGCVSTELRGIDQAALRAEREAPDAK
jgi:hypothetical protein